MMTTSVPRSWIPMMTEAGVAAESLFAGLTALRQANYAQKSLYNHAFFSISIGLERMMKLAILIECRTRPNGAYPTEEEFRKKYGHSLKRLFAKIEGIREGYSDRLRWDLPNREISMAALNILSDFAEFTRYYNLNVLVGSSRVGKQREPIEAWFNDVAALDSAKQVQPTPGEVRQAIRSPKRADVRPIHSGCIPRRRWVSYIQRS
jgi:hypothetical protein